MIQLDKCLWNAYNTFSPLLLLLRFFELCPSKNYSSNFLNPSYAYYKDIILAYAHIKLMKKKPNLLFMYNSYWNNGSATLEFVMSQI